MNIAVVGLGSMGKRRIRLIKEMYPDYNIIGIDTETTRRQEVRHQGVRCFDKLSNVCIKLDCVFVCTSPLSHNDIIREAINRGCHVFTELNLVSDGYAENMQLAKLAHCKLFLSSTFFYREEIKYIREHVSKEKKWNYIYHIGQYLPDWHPWENYQSFFLGDRRTNGCREILAIELPWIMETFGDVADVHVLSDKMTELEIDYKDNFMIQIVHDNGNKGCLIVDVVSPCAVRNLEIYTENDYISWNGTPESLRKYNSEKKISERIDLVEPAEHVDGYSAFIVENAYKNEIKEFFEVAFMGKEPLYDFKKDMRVLHIIDLIGA